MTVQFLYWGSGVGFRLKKFIQDNTDLIFHVIEVAEFIF